MAGADGWTRALQRTAAGLGVAFGLLTLVHGSRVLFFGADPGYVVFRPLLVYNVTMGLAYVAVGVLAWRSIAQGRRGAAAIFVLNLAVLAAIIALYTNGAAVARQSLAAMSFRTGLWLLIYALLAAAAWRGRRASH